MVRLPTSRGKIATTLAAISLIFHDFYLAYVVQSSSPDSGAVF
jgi:hypothetical protein